MLVDYKNDVEKENNLDGVSYIIFRTKFRLVAK